MSKALLMLVLGPACAFASAQSLSTATPRADVDVEIKNSQGTVVLATRCGGPILLVDLPSGGTWRVTAHSNGQSREKVLSAGAGRSAQATFIWPAGSS